MMTIKDMYNKVTKDKAARLSLQVIWQQKRDFTWLRFRRLSITQDKGAVRYIAFCCQTTLMSPLKNIFFLSNKIPSSNKRESKGSG